MMESMFKQATSGDVEDFKHLQMESAEIEPTVVLNEGHIRDAMAYNRNPPSQTGLHMQITYAAATRFTLHSMSPATP